ncbi:MAG: AAA-ATPase-like protein, partial [Clostridium butyricum DORA_1]
SKNLDELEEKAKEAINQIEDKKYDMELIEEGYRNIIKYGISFYRKECAIEIFK